MMENIKTLAGDSGGSGLHIAIVASRYNDSIVERLLRGCLDSLHAHGVDSDAILVARVPGAFELPLVARALAKKQKYDAIIALGAVIRGDTPHFEYISAECTHGIAETALQFDIPVVFGVLTVDDYEQAMLRSGSEESNKGAEAAMTALETTSVLAQIRDE
jgi:6,7-dimethyl-8-ribityllumazine synthase